MQIRTLSECSLERFDAFCVAQSHRSTAQRRSVVREIFSRNLLFTVDDLLTRLNARNIPVSRATVFRTLSILLDAEMISKNKDLYRVL